MNRKKTKAPSAPAAQSRDQVDALIGRVGEIQRELQRQDADLGDELARVKQQAEAKALPLKEELAVIQGQIQGWCEANRAALTREGKVKTADFTTGKVFWRVRPPKVSLRNVAAVLAYLQERGMQQFIRVTQEIDKEAMLRAPDQARLVPGVTVGSAGEDFIIEPFEAELAGAA